MKPGEIVLEHVPVWIPASGVVLQVDLSLPPTPEGVVLFVNDSSGSNGAIIGASAEARSYTPPFKKEPEEAL